MRVRSVLTLLLGLGAISSLAQTNSPTSATTVTVPALVRFSGTLQATSANVGVTFALYEDQTGGVPLWLESQNVSLDTNGHYAVNLGANHPGGLPVELFAAGDARWLGVRVEGGAEQPRVLLVSVPYAMKAAESDSLGGRPAAAYVTTDELANQLSVAGLLPTQASESAAVSSAESLSPASGAAKNPRRVWAGGSVNATTSSLLSFYTLMPCRVVDTRGATGALGGPSLVSGQIRTFPLLESGCFLGTAATPVAYSVNVTVIPKSGGDLGYLTVWPYGQGQPVVSTLNDATGLILANAAIVPAGSDSEGSVSVFASSTTATDLLIDVNGYFAAGTGTITGVTAGTDLTGGGTSGKVTVNLDTTKVPTLAATSNNFTGSITALSFSGSGAGVTNVTAVNSAELGGVAASNYPQLTTVNNFTNYQSVTAAEPGYAVGALNNYSTGGSGIEGLSNGTNGVGVFGEADTGTGAAGVSGVSTTGIGVHGEYGTASTVGSGLTDGLSGVWADTGNGNEALLATADDTNAAVIFNNGTFATLYVENEVDAVETVLYAVGPETGVGCEILTNGDLECSGTITEVERTKDRRALQMYSVQSTQNWYEDFGTGELKSGVANVVLDPDFAELANTSVNYHVFLTPNGNCKGLYAIRKTAASFEVHELGGGTASISFDYRIVAKRKGMESIRMADVTERMNALEASRPRNRKDRTVQESRAQAKRATLTQGTQRVVKSD
ncbi:MAG: hypothetical protein ABSD20_03600 [Terriglobales bacterium]